MMMTMTSDEARFRQLDDVINRMLLVLNLGQIEQFVGHCEVVAKHGFGKATITWRDGKVDLIMHEASDKAEE